MVNLVLQTVLCMNQTHVNLIEPSTVHRPDLPCLYSVEEGNSLYEGGIL